MSERLYELAALDMDGTLLNSAQQITPFTREALSRADAAGRVIALCTGRCLSELRYHLERVPAIRYAINESGGCIYDARNDRILRQAAIDDAAVERLFDLAAPYDVMLQCFVGNQSYVQPDACDRMEHWHMAAFRPGFIVGSVFIPDIRAMWRASGLPMTKFNLYFASEAEKARFAEEMGDMGLYVTGCLAIGYEISPMGAGKSDGLKFLCRHLGLTLEQAMAVGDGANDIDVMRTAGFSVAMGNAVEEVRNAADAVTDDCDHDGAAKAVLRYMLGER